MPHALGELALLVPDGRDAPDPAQLARLEEELAARDVAHRRVALGSDPAAAVHRELAAGTRFVVHCGGQRPLADALPALLPDDGADAPDVVLGMFPGGARNDFARTFGLTTRAEAAALLLASPRVMRVDVGTVTCRAPDGGEYRGWVLNEAVIGAGARAVREHAGRFRTLLGWWSAVATYRPRATDVDMVFAEWHAPATQVRLANGQYALGGLHAAPLALPDDGAWDVQVWDGPAHLPFTLQPRMVRGEHLPHEHISQWRQKRVTVDCRPPAPVAVDERRVGTTPATFELLPKALRLKI